MDFTYFIAAFIGLMIGVVASLVFVLSKGRSAVRLIVLAVVASLVVDGLVLINWAYVGDETAGFLILDFAFIATYSLVGCVLACYPPLAFAQFGDGIAGARSSIAVRASGLPASAASPIVATGSRG